MNLKKYLNEKSQYSVGTPKDDYENEIFKLDQYMENFIKFMFSKTKDKNKQDSDIYKDLYQVYSKDIQVCRRKLMNILKTKDQKQKFIG